MKFAVPLVLLAGCTSGGFEERLLGRIPDDSRVSVPVAFSLDGRRAAWVERDADSSRTICGGRSGKAYGILC